MSDGGISSQNRNAQVSENVVVWEGFDGVTFQVYKNDGNGQTLVSTGSNMNNLDPKIHKGVIVWRAFGVVTFQIYKNDGSGQKLVSDGISTNNISPTLQDDKIVWQGRNSDRLWQIYINEGEEGQKLISTGISIRNNFPQIDNGTIVWQGLDVNNQINEIYAFNCFEPGEIFPPVIPTLGQWSIIILGMIFLIFGVSRINKRSSTTNW